MMTVTEPRIVRRIYPTQHPCPLCGSTRHDPKVRSRPNGTGTSYIYRKCITITCGETYKVPLLAMEIENADGTTRIERV